MIPRTAFKKGNIPWNKGKKGLQKAWNKGLKGWCKKYKNAGFQKGHPIYAGSEKGWIKVKLPIIISCKQCKKLIKIKRYGWKQGDQKFCSRECWKIYHKLNNPMNKPEVRFKQLINTRKSQTEEWSKNNKKWMRPNKIEQKLILSMSQYNLPYKFVGNFEVVMGGKNPDFIQVNGKKKLIEIYGDYWHRNDNPQKRIDFFKKYGFDTLIIWEKEFDNLEEVIEKIKVFDNEI